MSISKIAKGVAGYLLCGVFALPGLALAQASGSYPSKPVRMIVPFPPGGAADLIARVLGQRMSEDLGQPVVIDNKAGANTIIGTDAVAKSAPDGYTILLTGDQSVAINPFLYATLPYDAAKDLVTVAEVAQIKLILAVNSSLPVNNAKELIEYAKRKPGELNYGSSGNGSMQHLAGALLAQRGGIQMTHVPYKGGSLATAALVSNDVNVLFTSANNLAPHIATGRVRAIGVSSLTKTDAMPTVPTIADSGLPGYDVVTWTGIFVPRGTPSAIVDRLHESIKKSMATPSVVQAALANGFEPNVLGPNEFRSKVDQDARKWEQVIKTANVKPEN